MGDVEREQDDEGRGIYSSYHLHRCIPGSCHRQSSSTTGDEMKWIFIHSRRTFHSKSSSAAFHSFRWTAHYFILPGNYFIEYFIASRWSFHALMATYSFIISFPHSDQFIHHFILPDNYFIEYFIASRWSFHSLMVTYSFIISFPHGYQFIHHFILPGNYFIEYFIASGDHFIHSWQPIHSLFHSLMATNSFIISFSLAIISFNISLHHGDHFIASRWSFHCITVIISLHHGDHFIHSWRPIHSLFHSLTANNSFIISFPLAIISFNISLHHGDYFIPSWQPIHSLFHFLTATNSFIISFSLVIISFNTSFPHSNPLIQYFIPSWQHIHSRFHSPWQLFHSMTSPWGNEMITVTQWNIQWNNYQGEWNDEWIGRREGMK